MSPLEDTAANNGFDVVATSWPIAISSAFTVTPVPAPTANVLSDVRSPPPIKPSPAITLLVCNVSTFPSSVVNLVENEPLSVSRFVVLVARLDDVSVKAPLT